MSMRVNVVALLALVAGGAAFGINDATWLQTNLLEKATVAAKADLPNVLILGDSISLGYTPFVRNRLKGLANVSRPSENCGPSQFYLKKMKTWVGAKHWDVIHVNFGIWDNHYMKGPRDGMDLYRRQVTNNIPPVAKGVAIRDLGYSIRTPVKVYEKNLRTILTYLKGRADHVIFALTTPMPLFQGDDRAGRIPVYNEVACAVCAELGVEVNDLYAVVEHTLDLQTDGCHFNARGYDRLAQAVCEKVRDALKKPIKPAPATKLGAR